MKQSLHVAASARVCIKSKVPERNKRNCRVGTIISIKRTKTRKAKEMRGSAGFSQAGWTLLGRLENADAGDHISHDMGSTSFSKPS
ncbi:hypothetical protein NC652_001590 [Populus alba x Populus x berolinensis]|nr:hypothetical protein NC652_001590 [Populus alba x Populus x berolinensis]